MTQMAESGGDEEYDIIQKLTIVGYLRDVINNEHDYDDIISIIVLYHQQGYANFFHSTLSKDYKQQMKFGDLVIKDSSIMVLNLDKNLEKVGSHEVDSDQSEEINVDIPFTICQKLTNAVSFYSKLPKHEYMHEVDFVYISLRVKYNDAWIMKNFGGKLNPNYQSIILKFCNGTFEHVNIYFEEKYSQIFHTNKKYIITAEGIDSYYNIRKEKENLIKLRVKTSRYLHILLYPEVFIAWQRKRASKNYVHYVGPKEEKDEMMKELNSFGEKYTRVNCGVIEVEVQDCDYFI